MGCPKCSDPDYMDGMYGDNCINPSCSLPGDKKETSISNKSSFNLEDYWDDRFDREDQYKVYRIPFQNKEKAVCIWKELDSIESIEIRSEPSGNRIQGTKALELDAFITLIGIGIGNCDHANLCVRNNINFIVGIDSILEIYTKAVELFGE